MTNSVFFSFFIKQKKFSETGFTKLFLLYEKAKKNAVGHAVVCLLLDGVKGMVNKDLSATNVVFCLPVMMLSGERIIALCGFANGY